MMNQRVVLSLAVGISLIIRLALVLSAPGVSLPAYETAVHVEHIISTGLPMTENPLGWLGAQTNSMPAFYYLIAFLSLFIPMEAALLFTPNILMALLPIPIWLIARQLTRNQVATTTITLASAFLPLLYRDTLAARPVSMALPLFFLVYYYFLRLDKTPKDQTIFAVSLVLLTITHPISILLIPAMAFTLLFAHIQRIPMSKALAEATIFSAFLIIWANGIVYKHALTEFGLQTFSIGYQLDVTSAGIITVLGVISLIGGVFGSYSAITEEKSLAAHAVIALALSALLAILLRIIRPMTAILLLSICTLILSTKALEALFIARRRSRVPALHSIAFVLIIAAFILTSAIPAIAVGVETYGQVPGRAEFQVIESIKETYQNEVVLWDTQHGYYLEAAGITSRIDENYLSNPDSRTIVEELEEIDTLDREIQIIQRLNEYEVEILVLPQSHQLSLGERCFEPLLDRAWEVYHLRCVVQ